MQTTRTLHTAHLTLRTLKKDDASSKYLGWLHDPKVNRYLISPTSNQTLESIEAYIDYCNASSDTLLLGIFKDEKHIGNIKLGPIDTRHSNAALGLMIGETKEWSKGYASESIQAISLYAFDSLGLKKLWAGCASSNLGSYRAFLKSGFSEEGRQHLQLQGDNGREDGVLLGRLHPSAVSH